MRAIIQRVLESKVVIDEKIKASINRGILVFIGIAANDTEEDIEWLVKKIVNMRIFSDEQGKMNLSVQDIDGEILVVSQFTLHASTKKGNRPSFIKAAPPQIAIPLYNQFLQKISAVMNKPVARGEFGADMKIHLVNDGPVTIIIDTKNKE